MRHGFRAAGDGHFSLPRHDALRGDRNRLQSRRAEAIDGHRRRFHRQSRAQRRDTRDVHSLFSLGHGAAQNHVLDFFRFETLSARTRLP